CAILTVTLLFKRSTAGPGRLKRIALLAALAGYLVFLGVIVRTNLSDYRLVARNFYGRLAVYDDADPREHQDAVRKLLHGVVIHGQHPLREEYRRMPVSYFCPKSGIGLAMGADNSGEPRRIGVLGLGCGSLAAYGRKGDTIRIYEINPLALAIAEREFTYLRDT